MDNLTVVIPFYNGHATIQKLLDCLPAHIPAIVVNDLSDHAPEIKRPQTRLLNLNKKGYFSGAVNAGIAACNTDVLVLNQDVELHGTEWLELLTKRTEYALIGEGIAGTHPAWPKGYIHGTFMFMRRDALDQIGLLNERDYPLWGATCEWQLRACRAGYQALPVRPVPGFKHHRHDHERFGTSIKQLLRQEPDKQGWLVRVPPMISVIIPTYNHGRYLEDAINSLIGGPTCLGDHSGQTFHAFEVIIVDDCSTDETPEIVRGLVDPWQGVRYIRRKKNGGTPAANNTGIAASYGKFITIMCGDDMMEPWRLEEMYRAIETEPDTVVYDDMMQFKHGERTIPQPMRRYDFDDLLYRNQMHCGIMFSKTAWKEIGGYPEVMRHGREDWAVNIALGVHGYCGKRLAEFDTCNPAHLRDYTYQNNKRGKVCMGYLYRREKQNRTITNTTPDWHYRFLAQLKSLYPQIYKGARPEMCCGPKNKPTKKSKGIAPALLGGAGMAMLEYIGTNVGKVTYYGAATGQRYIFGAKDKDKRKYVANEDVKGLLDIYEGRGPIFKRVPVAPQPAPAVAQAVEVEQASETVELETAAAAIVESEPEEIKPDIMVVETKYPEEDEAIEIVDPNDCSIAKFKDAIRDIDYADWQIQEMVQLEKDGKDRTGIYKALGVA